MTTVTNPLGGRTYVVRAPNVKLTRFHDPETGCRLGYRHDSPANWRIYQSDDGAQWAAVGPSYRTEKELLGDLHRYATEVWGFFE